MAGGEAPQPGPIEVEVKFAVGPGTEAALAALGAVGLPPTPPFRDCYFDGPTAPLARADVWLRHRQGQGWQLKLPHGDPRPPHGDPRPPHGDPETPHSDPRAAHGETPRGAEAARDPPETAGSVPPHAPPHTPPHTPPHGPPEAPPPGPSTAYREVWGEAAVLEELSRVLGAPVGRGGVGRALRPLGLRPTASFVTRRRGARVGGLRVERDEADFGYGVGEVEELVGDPREVPGARRRVEQLCRELGAEPQQRVPGKLSVFLARHRPRYYRRLRGEGRLEEVRGAGPDPPPHP